ncbi:McrB family protein [Cellulophaga omnivescoria]|uniref:McrB family protein n=1 Tax=Cellulophaga omnivescoria TaxID=1888890 RepID=UPI000984B215|nr:AAA family ATPase [Cellulophaga omnivescoria]
MNLPNQLTERESIDPKLAVGSSLPNPKGLLAIVLALYLVNEEKDYLDYSDKSGNTIILKPSLITSLKAFFNGITGYNATEIDSLASANPLVEMQIEPLQVPLQLFWKIAKINILGTDSSSGERTGGVRFPKELFFTTNMDILKNVISNENGDITNTGKELIYSWLTNNNTPTTSANIEQKLTKTLSVFTEETLFKTWNNSTEIIFQQEGIYNSFDTTNTSVDIGGTKEIKGTLRNLKSSISKDIHPYLKISSSNVELKNPSLATQFDNYQKRVSNYLDLNPKSIEIKIVETEEEINVDDVTILNKIYYGAPGTGKSHKVNELLKGKEERTERVTFHPEYDYASFIGGFKPITEIDAESGKEEIKYKFVPQTFTNIYVDAWNNKDNEYYLVIEEINRGNCAEIFGDIFQLLDRNSNYSITPSNELKQYLVKELTSVDGIKGIENGKMKLPSNLNILATMNTSDQSLFPMDSAFKRRWDWEYIPINYEKSEENPSSNYQVVVSDSISFSWLEFIEKVNTIIKENPNLGMDKCIGNYFIKAKDNSITLEEFINKAIFYLWNDVFKDEDDHIFEENTFYEDFFPIATNGKEKVLKILEKIGLNTPEKED